MKQLLKKYREFEKWFREDAELSIKTEAIFYSKGRYDVASEVVHDLTKIEERYEKYEKALREVEDFIMSTASEVLLPIRQIVKEALYPMPYKTVMKESELYGEEDVGNTLHIFMDFRKAEALLEVRGTDGKLIEAERVEPRKFGNLMEGFLAAVGDGATWEIQNKEGETKITIEKEEYEYVARTKDETFRTTDETEIIAYIDAKLEGIRSFCCDCTEGCRKCEWRGFYVESIR